MMDLTGKTAIVTGASSGFGRATAIAFAAAGCNVVLTARRQERLEEISQQIIANGGRAVCVDGDARDPGTADCAVEAAVTEFGSVDILINNAGIGRVLSLTDTTLEDYRDIMDTNVLSAFLFTRRAIPAMLKQGKGHVVNVSSVTGVYGHADETVYTASKFAIRGFTQAIDKEYREKGIKASVYCPGAAFTEFEIGHGRTVEQMQKRHRLTAEDGAEALLFICTRPDHVRVTEMRMTSMEGVLF